jgi:hypothetical protein
VVDKALPPSSVTLNLALVNAWPRLSGRVSFVAAGLETIELFRTDVVVSSHACGMLSDTVLDLAVAAGARVAVLPCCHHLVAGSGGGLNGWIDGALAIDITRAVRLQQRGYVVWTKLIPAAVTPKNRLLIAGPGQDLLLSYRKRAHDSAGGSDERGCPST